MLYVDISRLVVSASSNQSQSRILPGFLYCRHGMLSLDELTGELESMQNSSLRQKISLLRCLKQGSLLTRFDIHEERCSQPRQDFGVS